MSWREKRKLWTPPVSSRYLESSGCLIGSAFFQAGILNKKRSSARLLLYRTDLQSAGPLGLDVKLDELLLTTFKMIETEPTLSPWPTEKRRIDFPHFFTSPGFAHYNIHPLWILSHLCDSELRSKQSRPTGQVNKGNERGFRGIRKAFVEDICICSWLEHFLTSFSGRALIFLGNHHFFILNLFSCV